MNNSDIGFSKHLYHTYRQSREKEKKKRGGVDVECVAPK